MDPFEEASTAFLAWLRSSGADISSKIELKDLRDREAGRGVGKQAPPTWLLAAIFTRGEVQLLDLTPEFSG
jgi:hypothetical protein